jgi:hypothetical protein
MKHTCPKGKSPTHTRIGSKDHNIYGGSYIIEGKDLDVFYPLYYDYVFVKGNKEYLTEKQPDEAPLYVDFDFRFCYDVEKRIHTKEHIENIIFCYTEHLKAFFNFKNQDNFKVYVMEKPNVNRLEDKSLTKDGIHILFGLNMSHKLQLKLRELVMKDVPEIWGNLHLTNTWDSVFDEGISKGTTNWQLFGSRKPANEAYEISSVFKFEYDATDGEFMLKPVDFEMTFETFKELSSRSDVIRPNFPISSKWNKLLNENIKTERKQTKKTKLIIEDDETDSENSDNGVSNKEFNVSDVYYKYLNCIGSSMCGKGQHLETINVLQALKNENCDKKYVKYWVETFCSPELKKYSYALNHYSTYIYYTPLSTEKRLSIKSLKKWAKKYNPKLYGTYFKDDYEFQIQQMYDFDTLIKDHADETIFRDLVFDLTKKYVILDKNLIYLYFNDEWNVMNENNCRMLKFLIIEIFDIYIKTALDIINNKLKCNLNNEEICSKGKALIKNTIELNKSIKKNNYINNICNLLKDKLSAFKNEIVFDLGEDNFYKIHFKNGVYDLKEKIFRSRTEADYITQYLPYDYKEETQIDDKIKEDVFGFFQKIQPDSEQRKFTLSYLAYCLTGNATKQIFKMNIGHTASNGKSTEMSIHDKCFELYSMKADSRVLQLNFDKRHKFLHDLVTKPIRFIYFEELPKGKKLDVEFIKNFVDGKKLDLEKMFGTTDKLLIQAKMMSASNHDFQVDTDEGILRRGRVQYYESKFTDDIDCVDETNHIYKKEEGFENKFNNDDYKNAYFHLLLKYIDELYVPKKNKEDFKQKAEEGDDILNNILEYFEITKNCDDIITKIEIENCFGKEHFNEYKSKLQSKGCKYESQKKYYYKEEDKWKSGLFTNLKKVN